MLGALLERFVAPNMIVGTSVGALNGAFIASRSAAPSTSRQLEDVWRAVGRWNVLPLNPLTGFFGFFGAPAIIWSPTTACESSSPPTSSSSCSRVTDSPSRHHHRPARRARASPVARRRARGGYRQLRDPGHLSRGRARRTAVDRRRRRQQHADRRRNRARSRPGLRAADRQRLRSARTAAGRGGDAPPRVDPAGHEAAPGRGISTWRATGAWCVSRSGRPIDIDQYRRINRGSAEESNRTRLRCWRGAPRDATHFWAHRRFPRSADRVNDGTDLAARRMPPTSFM